MIKLEHITKIYSSNNIESIALDDVSLVLPDKGFVAIYGASGCGKTTLLNILGGLDHQTSGNLTVNGRDTSRFTTGEWDSYRNQEVGFIFQQYFLLPHLNVYDNIAITLQMSGKTRKIEDEINNALSEVGILQLRKRYPKSLSGGQQQRVAIARALISNPSVVLADEPTGALDQKNAVLVMESLKKVSENHLVVMVTHNEKLAMEYADRLIEISYGKIASDSAEMQYDPDAVSPKELHKVHLPMKTSMKWSGRNVIKKKSRSIPIMIASAVGLAAVGIVLCMTSGINSYTKKVQEASLTDYPVYITSYPKNSSQAHEDELEEYPEIDEVLIEKAEYYETAHYNSIQEDFMEYMDKMPTDYYTMKDNNSAINFPVIAFNGTSYQKVNSMSNFTRIAPSHDNFGFIGEQYSVLEGRFPEEIDDCVLVIDSFNRVDLNILEKLGFPVERDSIKFSEIIGKEYHIIAYDDMYYTNSSVVNKTTNEQYYKIYGSAKYEELYKTKTAKTLTICGIIRQKDNTSAQLFSTGILYAAQLTDWIKDLSSNSEIVKKQLAYEKAYEEYLKEQEAKKKEEEENPPEEPETPEDPETPEEPEEPKEPEIEVTGPIDVLSGTYFKDVYSGSYHFTATYQYESRLYDLGYKERITSIYYYTDSFEDRINIVDYFKAYKQKSDSAITLKSKDYLEQVTTSFSSLVNTFSTIILFFAMASILIAAILTAILTYISVLERRKEIGLLRSLGARRWDVSLMFLTESFIIGTAAAVLACALIGLLLPITGKIIVNLITVFGSKDIRPKVSDIAAFKAWVFPAVFVGSIILSTVSALVPAIIAGKRKPAESLRE